jgi:hypothetical protein
MSIEPGASKELEVRRLPSFEGKPVSTTKIRIVSPVGLDIDNEVLRMDDIVRMVVEGRVTKVEHVVNDKSGEIERIQTIKVIEVGFEPWGASDRGIL